MSVIKAFISYASKDKDEIRPILDDIKSKAQDQFECFFYDDSKKVGQKTYDDIIAGLEEASVFIYFHSKNSKKSEYVQNEIGYALARDKIILPLKIDRSRIKGMLQDRNFINIDNQKDMAQLESKIKELRPVQQTMGIPVTDTTPSPSTEVTQNSSTDDTKTNGFLGLLATITIIGSAYLLFQASRE